MSWRGVVPLKRAEASHAPWLYLLGSGTTTMKPATGKEIIHNGFLFRAEIFV